MNRTERRRAAHEDPTYAVGVRDYERARLAAGERRGLAWASMVYACVDAQVGPRPVPPGWDQIVAGAPAGYWEERGGIPETVEIEGREMFPARLGGCGFWTRYLLCVGVEQPRTMSIADYPEVWVPSPLVCGRCPRCGLPLSHFDWLRDMEWWPPTELPEGASFFRLPDEQEAREFALKRYGGAEFVAGEELRVGAG